MVDTSYFYVKVNGDPVGDVEWMPAHKDTTQHLENDDIYLEGYDDNGDLFTRCAEHPDQLQKWMGFDEPMELATFALQNFLMENDLDNRTSSPWGRPGGSVVKDRYAEQLNWREFSFTFDEDRDHRNRYICDGLILRPRAEGAADRADVIALFERGFLGIDVVEYLAYNDWVSG